MRSICKIRAFAILAAGVVLFATDIARAQVVPSPRSVHIIVALADNQYQGIIPVPKALGNGDDPNRNLYWGAGYGVRTFLKRSLEWQSVGDCTAGSYPVLERCVFRHKSTGVLVVADAYRGREIRRAITDFFAFAAGRQAQTIAPRNEMAFKAGGAADLIVYVGHDGLMDFSLARYDDAANRNRRDAIVLACASKQFFAAPLRRSGANPLLWTTGLMAPEAYVVEAALAGWARNEKAEEIRARAARAYDKYQHCALKAALRLFATGW